IEQIYINQNNDIQLATRVGDIEIILGDYKDYKEKLDKLYTFYKNIVPVEGWDKYSSVNLKYKGQIICKLKKRK
ncbi:MAG: cell division protein FtsQ, partial [Bacteroidales bacterium]|nr:cell division protein FtsQ [Bacteroidales bacterium]